MSTHSSPVDELRRLTDLLFDGQIDASGLTRIDHLIVNDQRCLQAYVEQLDFHAELLDQADLKSSEAAALDVLRNFSVTCAAQESLRQWRMNFMLLAATLLVATGLGRLYYSSVLVPSPVGTVASLSTDLQADRPYELGQIVRWGQTIQVTSGVISLQLADVTVDVVGPASLKLEQKRRVYLSNGTVVAKVDPAGTGFTVRTPDSEVIDLGTEFLVQHETQNGTYVSVRRGEAHAKLLDWRGIPTKIIELTASRAAVIQRTSEVARETEYSPERYRPVDQSRKGIRRLTGTLRTVSDLPANLASGQLTTPNHMLVIPEQQVTLEADLTVASLNGPITIPRGTTVSSYLIHYDPTDAVSFAPRGSVSFHGNVIAVVSSISGLLATDSQLGLRGAQFESQKFRELESDEDEVQLSDDKKTVSFFFGSDPPEFLDECRILVIDAVP